MTRLTLCVIASGITVALSLTGMTACSGACTSGGNNSTFLAPTATQFQLVVDNNVSRDIPVYVNNVQTGTVCSGATNVIIGNYDTAACTYLAVYDEVDACMWHMTSCSTFQGLMCSETCDVQPGVDPNCIDTTAIGGKVRRIDLCFEDQC